MITRSVVGKVARLGRGGNLRKGNRDNKLTDHYFFGKFAPLCSVSQGFYSLLDAPGPEDTRSCRGKVTRLEGGGSEPQEAAKTLQNVAEGCIFLVKSKQNVAEG